MAISTKFFYKICIVGDSGVGKTTLLHQYIDKVFKSSIGTTIGSHFFVKYLKLPKIKNLITLQVWDLAGQEHFKWVRYGFYKGARGIVYVFDLTNKESFNNIRNWKKEVEKRIGIKPNILVGNKLDLMNPEENNITLEESGKLRQELQACAYLKTSAKLGTKVDDVFKILSLEMYKSINK
ncbi:MAG: Rab family GTPase [Promethearchaeota archaeon]